MEAPARVQVDPVIVHTKGALERAVANGIERALKAARTEWERERGEAPEFGWITNDRAMELLGVSRATLARWRADGTLVYSRLGQNVYYPISALEEILLARVVDRSIRGEPAVTFTAPGLEAEVRAAALDAAGGAGR